MTPHRFFAYLPDCEEFCTYATAAEAQAAADSYLDTLRDEAGTDGWPDEAVMPDLCWGEIRASVVETSREACEPDEDGAPPAFDWIATYELRALDTPDLFERAHLALDVLRKWVDHQGAPSGSGPRMAIEALAESLADEGYRRADDTGDRRDRDACPECGRMVHADAPAGLCPRCEDEARGDDTDGDLDEYEGDADDVCEECGDRDQTCEHGCCSRCCACWDEPHAADPDIVDGVSP